MTTGPLLLPAAFLTHLLTIAQLINYAFLSHVRLGFRWYSTPSSVPFRGKKGIGYSGLSGWVVDAQTALGIGGCVELSLHYINKGMLDRRC